MAESIDLSDVIGVFPLTNVGAVLVHKLDYGEDKVLASVNGEEKTWCSLIEKLDDDIGELEPGFYLGSIFVSMKDVMRFYGRNG